MKMPMERRYKHINMLGSYAFTLSDTVARGELRPVRRKR
jgi:hypothetical protein